MDEVKNLIVGTNNNQPVYLHQIAEVEDGPEVSQRYVSFGYGVAQADKKANMPDDYSTVTDFGSQEKRS